MLFRSAPWLVSHLTALQHMDPAVAMSLWQSNLEPEDYPVTATLGTTSHLKPGAVTLNPRLATPTTQMPYLIHELLHTLGYSSDAETGQPYQASNTLEKAMPEGNLIPSGMTMEQFVRLFQTAQQRQLSKRR